MDGVVDYEKDYEGGSETVCGTWPLWRGGSITVWGTWKGKSSMEKTLKGVRSLSAVH